MELQNGPKMSFNELPMGAETYLNEIKLNITTTKLRTARRLSWPVVEVKLPIQSDGS